jgi:Ca-activated chloride channel family protein
VAVTLEIPATPAAGMRFDVHWTGPAASGDFLAIAETTAPVHRYLDWASTSVGSPVTLAAPERAGTFEVRYVTQNGREILARVTIQVRQ